MQEQNWQEDFPVLGASCYLCAMRLTILLWAFVAAALHCPAQVDYRFYQSPVRSVPLEFSQAAAIASMLETCLGAPGCVSSTRLEQLTPKQPNGKPSPYLFQYSESLQKKGVPACENEDETGSSTVQTYIPTNGTVFHWTAANAKNTAKINSLLDRGQKAIVVNYRLPADAWQKALGEKRAVLEPGNFIQVKTEGKTMAYGKALKKYPDLTERLKSKEFQLVANAKDSGSVRLIGATVVGRDADGYWVKGCSGGEWGDQGYAKVPYVLHEWACEEVLAMLMLEPEVKEASGANHLHSFQLRTLPEQLEGRPMLQLFLVEAGNLPVSPVTHLQYEVIPQAGDTLAPKTYKSLISDLTAQSGYPILATISDKSKTYDVKLRYRCESGEVRELTYRNVRWENAAYKP